MTEKNTENTEADDNVVEGEVLAAAEAEAEVSSEADADAEQKLNYDELALTLQNAEAKADEHWNQLLLVQAELDNARRRAERDVQSARKFALEKFVNELLPVKDSLDLGEAAARAEGADIEKVAEGLEMASAMMASVLLKFGVVEINPEGDKFNPELHQAMSMQDVADVAPNTVITVFQKGYQLNERLVRPAMVVVASVNSGANIAPDPDDEPPTDTKLDEMA